MAIKVQIGRMDRKITLRQRVLSRDSMGGVSETWQDMAVVFAEKLDIIGREFIAAQQVNAEISTKFRIRYRVDINTTWRISYDGRDYDIISIAELGRRRWLEIMANAAVSKLTDF